MTEKHEKLLADLELRLHQLMYLCDSLKAENQSLKVRLEAKGGEINRVSSVLEELNQKYNDLMFANTLTGTGSDGVEEAKNRLNKLVQEVDKCIALLKI